MLWEKLFAGKKKSDAVLKKKQEADLATKNGEKEKEVDYSNWRSEDDYGITYRCALGGESFTISNLTFRFYNPPTEPGYWEYSWKNGMIWHPDSVILKDLD